MLQIFKARSALGGADPIVIAGETQPYKAPCVASFGLAIGKQLSIFTIAAAHSHQSPPSILIERRHLFSLTAATRSRVAPPTLSLSGGHHFRDSEGLQTPADSICHRNTSFKLLSRRLEVQRLPGTFVQPSGHLIETVLRVG
ncbi:hypothetical protein, partial [Duganella vulcania]|uniref:hypothetical protein n=1 Tax=Duganella vulcania TaxID=2692166 RepID=UPI001C2D6DE5